ncbi:MAG TPA: DegT/DnrJ/EryC1/StrS family aminotransferase [Longimicrobiales bacterium]
MSAQAVSETLGATREGRAAEPRRSTPWRHQPPVHSPVPLRAFVPAVRQVLRLAPDPRPGLAALLEEIYGGERVVLCSSGTAALQLAIRVAAAHAGEPGPVALPAYTCYDVASAAIGAGASLVVYDVEPSALAPDLESLERAVRAGARVVVVSPLYGIPVDWGSVQALCDRYGAVLVEDAAQGHGAAWCGRPIGSLGAISVLSFGRGKGWTGGKGGALLLRGAVAAAHARVDLATASAVVEAGVLAASLAQHVFGRPGLYALPRAVPWLHLGETRYRPPTPPAPMTRAAAALLRASKDAADREAGRRRANAELFRARLEGIAGIRVPAAPPQATPGYLRFPVLVRGGIGALGPSGLVRRFGIEAGYPRPLSELGPVRARLAFDPGRLPGAEALARELVTLPTSSLVSEAEKHTLVHILQRSRR